MQIVELGDCSMVIMKDSSDTPWDSVGNYYRHSKRWHEKITVIRYEPDNNCGLIKQVCSDTIYTAGRLVLFFSDPINPGFHLHDKVLLA